MSTSTDQPATVEPAQLQDVTADSQSQLPSATEARESREAVSQLVKAATLRAAEAAPSQIFSDIARNRDDAPTPVMPKVSAFLIHPAVALSAEQLILLRPHVLKSIFIFCDVNYQDIDGAFFSIDEAIGVKIVSLCINNSDIFPVNFILVTPASKDYATLSDSRTALCLSLDAVTAAIPTVVIDNLIALAVMRSDEVGSRLSEINVGVLPHFVHSLTSDLKFKKKVDLPAARVDAAAALTQAAANPTASEPAIDVLDDEEDT